VFLPSCCISTGAIIPNDRQAAIVSERNEASTAGRLALMVIITEGAIAAVFFSPDLAVRSAHRHIEAIQCLFLTRVPIECLSPSGMLTGGGRHAELLLTSNVDTLSRAGALRDPGRVDVGSSRKSALLRIFCMSLICLLLREVLEEG